MGIEKISAGFTIRWTVVDFCVSFLLVNQHHLDKWSCAMDKEVIVNWKLGLINLNFCHSKKLCCFHEQKPWLFISLQSDKKINLDLVYMVPDPCGHDIEFGQFTVIFTPTTFPMISFY